MYQKRNTQFLRTVAFWVHWLLGVGSQGLSSGGCGHLECKERVLWSNKGGKCGSNQFKEHFFSCRIPNCQTRGLEMDREGGGVFLQDFADLFDAKCYPSHISTT